MGTFRALATPEDAPSRGPWCDTHVESIGSTNTAFQLHGAGLPARQRLGLVDVVAEATATFGNIGAGSGASPYQGVGQAHIGIHWLEKVFPRWPIIC